MLRSLRWPGRAAVALLLAVPLALAGCSDAVGRGLRYPPGGLTIASGGTQGVYYRYAKDYERVLERELKGLDVRVVSTGGAVDNLKRIGRNQAQLGFATADTLSPVGPDGGQPATVQAPRDLRAIARIYDEYIHLVVRRDATVSAVRDLRGLRVSTGQQDSSTEVVADRVLGAVGLSADRDLRRHRDGIDASLTKLASGQLDAFFWSGGLPTPGIERLARTVPLRLVPLGEQVNALRKNYGTFYRRAMVPTSTYEGVPQTVTIGVPDYLVVAGDVDADLVHALTRVLFENRAAISDKGDELDDRSAISTLPIPLHAGAERYYRDVKP